MGKELENITGINATHIIIIGSPGIVIGDPGIVVIGSPGKHFGSSKTPAAEATQLRDPTVKILILANLFLQVMPFLVLSLSLEFSLRETIRFMRKVINYFLSFPVNVLPLLRNLLVTGRKE